MTKIELTNQYGTYTVTVLKDDLNASDIIDDVVYPVLLAAGYHHKNIEEAFGRSPSEDSPT